MSLTGSMPEYSVTNWKLGLKSMKTGMYNVTRRNQLDYIAGYFSHANLHAKNMERKETKRKHRFSEEEMRGLRRFSRTYNFNNVSSASWSSGSSPTL